MKAHYCEISEHQGFKKQKQKEDPLCFQEKKAGREKTGRI